MAAKGSILVVEDEAATVTMLRSLLEKEHYRVSVATTAIQARGLFEKGRPDLIILDRNLPDKDGLEFCRELRAEPEFQAVPILFLSERKSLSERVVGLKMGGDDYLAKPFSPEELLARIEALLRRARSPEQSSDLLARGPIRLELEGRIARVAGKEVSLTKKEFDLLRAFLERAERVLTRQFLLSHVWGYDMELQLSTNAVDMMVMGLRRKLGKCGEWIEAVPGHGYRFRTPE